MPYWGLRVALARLLGARIIGYAIGVGPLKHRLSRLFARLAFACMDTISVRDPEAMKVASELSGRKIHLVPDPALALKPSPNYMAENLLKQFKVPLDGSPLIGVAARKWFHTRGNFIPHKYAYRWGLVGTDGEHECRKMVQRLAGVLDRIVEAHSAYVVFLPTYNVAHEGDDRICQSVQDHMQSNRTSLIRTAQPRLYKAVTGRLDLVLGSRMHPAILAAGMGTPVVGLSYNPKFAGFFQLIGRKDLCLPIDDLLRLDGPDRLYQMMNASIRNRRSSKKVVEDLILNFEAFYGMMEC
jgi:polysaccharide pyruvyl transferase WcaK-like protein